MVMVTVDVSVAGNVTSAVSDTALGVRSAAEMVGVFEGRGLLVAFAVRLGVKDGSADGRFVGVDDAEPASGFAFDGKPDPIKMKRIQAKRASAITLK